MTSRRARRLCTAALVSLGSVHCSKDSTSPGGQLTLSATAVAFVTGAGGANPLNQAVQVSASGSAGGISVGATQYTGPSGWLSVLLAGSAAPTTITLIVNAAGLAAGTLVATIPVLDSTAKGSPQTITVTLTVPTATPARLALAQQPAGAVSGVALSVQPVIEIEDLNGAVVSGATNLVTVSVASGSVTLSGVTTEIAVNGIATFTNLAVTGSGSFALAFMSSGLIQATAAGLSFTGAPASISFGTGQLILNQGATGATSPVVRDVNNNIDPGTPLTFTSRTSAIATVNASGTITGVAPGQAVIVVSVTGSPALADSLMAVVGVAGAPILISSLNGFSLARDTTLTISIYADMGSSTKRLGSGTINVSWNPIQLGFVGTAAGAAVSPAVNASAQNGTLQLSFASSAGFTGNVEVLKITFTTSQVLGLGTGTFSIACTDLSATDFTDLTSNLVAVAQPLILR